MTKKVKKDSKKKQSGLTWTQICLIIAIIFGVYQTTEKIQLEEQMSRCICNWDQAVERISGYLDN